MAVKTLLVVDDEDLIRWSLTQQLSSAGHRVLEAASGAQALDLCHENTVDLVLLDYQLPDTDGLSLIKAIKDQDADTVVIMMTAHSTVERAVEAMQSGAYHFTRKPFKLDDMLSLVERGLETTRLRREVKTLRAGQTHSQRVSEIIGDSEVMRATKALLGKVAQAPSSTVLLTGESGTGKDLAAKAIHNGSARSEGPFMNITCSALPEALLESELFGHEKGAFTDARARKRGLLELAATGTVFLDEIGEMSPVLQSKLLRVLEEKTFKRVGGSEDVKVDVRIIAATNRDLLQRVRENTFREDLYFRLQVLPVHLPALRERAGDVALLCDAFIGRFNREFGKHVTGISPEGRARLDRHGWPGNVRELKNALKRAILLADGTVLTADDFRMLTAHKGSSASFTLPAEGLDMQALERDLVTQALQLARGNHTRAAALLGMNRDQMRYRIEKFGLGRGHSESG